jgi:hypothetical protein
MLYTGCGADNPSGLDDSQYVEGEVSFEGHVTSAVDGTPISGVHVGLYHIPEIEGVMYYYDYQFQTWTDSAGYYQLGPKRYSGRWYCPGGVWLQSRCQYRPPSDAMCTHDWQDSERVDVTPCTPGEYTIDLQLTPK